MTSDIGGGAAGPWYRIQAITAGSRRDSGDGDYAAVLPAALNAAAHRRPFIAGWLSRGDGAPLELITNAGPFPSGGEADDAQPNSTNGQLELLFPWGARGVAIADSVLADLDRLAWVPCLGRQAPALTASPAAATGWHASGGSSGSGVSGGSDPGSIGGSAGGAGVARTLPAGDSVSGVAATLFETALTTLMGRPFGWLVVAEPTGSIDAETAELRTQLNVLRRYEEERARFDVHRAERRLAELDAYREAGLWSVRVLAGAATAQALSLIAPVLVGSVDLGAHPYRLRSTEGARELADALAQRLSDPADGAQVPFAATAGTLAALTGLPRREVPGVRVLEPGYFDLTSETGDGRPTSETGDGRPTSETGDGRPTSETGDRRVTRLTEAHAPGQQSAAEQGADAWNAVELGTILDGQDRPVGSFWVPLDTLNRHAFVTGATGSGKSQTVRHLLEQLARAGLPWLAIEPVKSEYAAMAGRIAGTAQVTVINPSDPDAVPLSVNPLAPEPGYPVQAHIDMVRALFLAAFDAHEPFPQIISQALQRAYAECGWDPVTGAGVPGAAAPPATVTLARLQRAALEVIEDVGYGRELQADVRGFVEVRLRSLRIGSAGRFFEGGHPVDIAELLRRHVVLAIEDVANDEDKAFLIGTLIIRIVEHLRLRARAEPARGLRHVIVIEEAHRLLRARRDGPGAHAVELFASMLAEIRAYGEGIVVAEQIPAKLIPDVVKNTALKVLHRLPAADDRQVVGAAMNLDEGQSRQVVSLRPGVAAVFADGMDRPLRIRVPFGGDRERPPAGQEGPPAPVRGRRSSACGPVCVAARACTLRQIRTADLLATSPDQAWLRIWAEGLVLAVLTNRPLPVVPAPLRQAWSGHDERLRQCLLASALDQATRGRSLALRSFYDPERISATTAAIGLRLLEGGAGAGARPGPAWVIPQLQWLHEIDKVCPAGSARLDPFDPAPRLDYPLPGLADRPDTRIGQRVTALRRHPLSMELPRNRLPAWTVLLGEDDQRGFCEDLAEAVIGVSHRGQLLKAAGEMGIRGWLETVLSWPRRFIAVSDETVTESESRETARAGR